MDNLERFFLDRKDTLLVIIDIQDRLARVMKERETVVNNVLHLVELAKLFNMPVVVTEQYPRGLGPTVAELKDALGDNLPIEKITFSCSETEHFRDTLKKIDRKKVLLTGMETHVCVLQTCLDLLRDGYRVHLVTDATTSRKPDDKSVAVEFMRDAGAVITCTETVLFQILKKAGTEEFKVISRRIK
ncbi:MAG: hydrolase [Nitrospirae bacterium]|nr:hydrolase [Nitrospirota bacterium]